MADMLGRSEHLRQILGSCEGNVEVSNRVDPYQIDREKRTLAFTRPKVLLKLSMYF